MTTKSHANARPFRNQENFPQRFSLEFSDSNSLGFSSDRRKLSFSIHPSIDHISLARYAVAFPELSQRVTIANSKAVRP